MCWIADDENNFHLFGIPFMGRQTGQERNTNLGRDIVTELATPLFKSGRNVTCDNNITDMVRVQTLLKNGLAVVGTVRGNKRLLPDSLTSGRQIALHDSEFAYNQNELSAG